MHETGSSASPDPAAWGRIGAHLKWANTTDRTAATPPARAALEQKFLDQADGDPVRAGHLRKASFQRLALKSAQARRAKKAGAAARLRSTLAADSQDEGGPDAARTTRAPGGQPPGALRGQLRRRHLHCTA